MSTATAGLDTLDLIDDIHPLDDLAEDTISDAILRVRLVKPEIVAEL